MPAPLLVIGIPSARRDGDPDYVQRTVQFVREQLAPGTLSDIAGPHALRVRVIVMSNHRAAAPPHAAFDALEALECRDGCNALKVGGHAVRVGRGNGSRVLLARNGWPLANDGDDLGSANVPGFRVRQQARDVADLLELTQALFGHEGGGPRGDKPEDGALSQSAGRMAIYMVMEDDFRLCPRGLESLAFLLARARVLLPEWNALRVSYGLNGALVRGFDVPQLAAHYRESFRRRPPDHLLVEWFAGERDECKRLKAGRPHGAFRYNLLEHFGLTSSLRAASSGVYPFCYQLLDDKVVFEVEAFRIEQCAHDQLWPCLPPTGPFAAAEQTQTDIPFETLRAEGPVTSLQKW
jgi:hypothetical protein